MSVCVKYCAVHLQSASVTFTAVIFTTITLPQPRSLQPPYHCHVQFLNSVKRNSPFARLPLASLARGYARTPSQHLPSTQNSSSPTQTRVFSTCSKQPQSSGPPDRHGFMSCMKRMIRTLQDCWTCLAIRQSPSSTPRVVRAGQLC